MEQWTSGRRPGEGGNASPSGGTAGNAAAADRTWPGEWTPARRASWLRAVYGDAWYERHTAPRGSSVADEYRWGDRLAEFVAAAYRAWTRIDPDGWVRPRYTWQWVREIASGRSPAWDAWECWVAGPSVRRQSRRRADAIRRVRRMDGSDAAVAIAGGRLARRVRPAARRRPGGDPVDLGSRHTRWADVRDRRLGGAAPSHSHPGWAVRRARVIRWIALGVAGGSLRAAAVPDAWAIASAASDGIHVLPLGDGRPVPDA